MTCGHSPVDMWDYCYAAEEFRQMVLDLKFGLAVGVDGFVFGCLNADGTVDQRRTAHIVKLAAGRQTVFHRAFDVTPDPLAALETLVELGVTRILTSGQQPTAGEGAALIRQLVARAAGRIEILPGSGVRAGQAAALVQHTGVTQIHASASLAELDRSTHANPTLSFGGTPASEGERHRVVDAAQVAALRAEVGD